MPVNLIGKLVEKKKMALHHCSIATYPTIIDEVKPDTQVPDKAGLRQCDRIIAVDSVANSVFR